MKIVDKAQKFIQLLSEQLPSGNDAGIKKKKKGLKKAFYKAIQNVHKHKLKAELVGDLDAYFEEFCRAVSDKQNESQVQAAEESAEPVCEQFNTDLLPSLSASGEKQEEGRIEEGTISPNVALCYNLFVKHKINKGAIESLPANIRMHVYKCFLNCRLPGLQTEDAVYTLLQKCNDCRGEEDVPGKFPWMQDIHLLCSSVSVSSDPGILQLVMKIAQSKIVEYADNYLRKKKGRRQLREELVKILVFFHWKYHSASQPFPSKPYYDLMASLLSVLTDLSIMASRHATEEEQSAEGKLLCSKVLLLLSDQPQYGLDVMLQQTALCPADLSTVRPLYRRILEVAPPVGDPVVYTKYMLAVRKVKGLSTTAMAEQCEKACQVPAPDDYIDWLREQDADILDNMPETRHFKGTQISRFLLEEAEDELVEQLLNLLTEEQTKERVPVTEKDATDETIGAGTSEDQGMVQQVEPLSLYFIDKGVPIQALDDEEEALFVPKVVQNVANLDRWQDEGDGSEADVEEEEEEEENNDDDKEDEGDREGQDFEHKEETTQDKEEIGSIEEGSIRMKYATALDVIRMAEESLALAKRLASESDKEETHQKDEENKEGQQKDTLLQEGTVLPEGSGTESVEIISSSEEDRTANGEVPTKDQSNDFFIQRTASVSPCVKSSPLAESGGGLQRTPKERESKLLQSTPREHGERVTRCSTRHCKASPMAVISSPTGASQEDDCVNPIRMDVDDQQPIPGATSECITSPTKYATKRNGSPESFTGTKRKRSLSPIKSPQVDTAPTQIMRLWTKDNDGVRVDEIDVVELSSSSDEGRAITSRVTRSSKKGAPDEGSRSQEDHGVKVNVAKKTRKDGQDILSEDQQAKGIGDFGSNGVKMCSEVSPPHKRCLSGKQGSDVGCFDYHSESDSPKHHTRSICRKVGRHVDQPVSMTSLRSRSLDKHAAQLGEESVQLSSRGRNVCNISSGAVCDFDVSQPHLSKSGSARKMNEGTSPVALNDRSPRVGGMKSESTTLTSPQGRKSRRISELSTQSIEDVGGKPASTSVVTRPRRTSIPESPSKQPTSGPDQNAGSPAATKGSTPKKQAIQRRSEVYFLRNLTKTAQCPSTQ